VSLPLEDGDSWIDLRARFDGAHARTYGYSAPTVEVEVLNLRVAVISPVERATLPSVPRADGRLRAAEERAIYSLAAERLLPTPVYRREELRAGDAFGGPAAIEEPSTTTVVEPGDRVTVDPHGFLVVEIGG
jgi:N-methylhydantoinase A